MANTQPYEIVAGPLHVFFAPTGAAFPSIDNDNTDDLIDAGTIYGGGGTWTYIGYTEGGVKVGSPQTVVELRADQVTGPIKAVRSEEALELVFDVASLTLENYQFALNQAFSGDAPASVALYRGGFQVQTLAFIARNDHLSPYGDAPLQFEVPVVFQAGNPEATFTKDNKAVLAVSLHALVDPNRDSDEESFGRVRTEDD